MSAIAAIILDPFKALQPGGMERFEIPSGQTIRQWLDTHFSPGWVSFELPTILAHNGERLMRAEWENREIRDGDTVVISTCPGDVVTIILAVVAIVVAIAAVLLMPDPANPGQEGRQSDSVFNWRGQDNKLRIGEPIEVPYGRCRLFPSYAAPPYSRYIGNDAVLFSLFVVGQGTYEIEDDKWFFEDTDVSDFEEVEIEVIEPGDPVTLFDSTAVTSGEVSNIELYGTNQAEFPVSGWHGPYTANVSGTTVTRLEVDLVFPQGVYFVQSSLRFALTVGWSFEYRKIDDAGDPVGDWETLDTSSITKKAISALRFTLSQEVPAGRYEVRGKRTTTKSTSASFISTLMWESLKAYSANANSYGNVTLVALKAKATNNLNGNTRSRLNCFATRKLPIYDAELETWSIPTATRNPLWAFCDLFKASYGAKLSDEYLDLPTIASLAETAEEREDWFDHVFDQRQSVWETARTILRVMRSVPIPQGSLVTAVRDEPRGLPAAMFTSRNIAKGSMVKSLAMFSFQSEDHITVTYKNPLTWKEEEVVCALPGSPRLFERKITLAGCTSRQQAFREGMYMMASRIFKRKTVQFKTGMEGMIPTYMDLVSVSEPLVGYSQGGFVVSYDTGTNVATLSERVVLPSDETCFIVFRGNNGAAMGDPIAVTAGANPNQVVLATDPVDEILSSLDSLPTLYHLGPAERWAFLGNVSRIEPDGQETVSITLTNYDERVFAYDELEAPALAEVQTIRNPQAPAIGLVTVIVKVDDASTAIVSWQPAAGALTYIVDSSLDDGETWERLAVVPASVLSWETPVIPGDWKLRVAAVGQGGQGPWTESALTEVGTGGPIPAVPVLDDPEPFVGLSMATSWQPAANASGYTVSVYTGMTELRVVDIYDSLSFEYTLAMMLEDGTPSRDLEVRVQAYGAGNLADGLAINSQTNPSPDAPGSPGTAPGDPGEYVFSWDAVDGPPEDFAFYRVYGSTSPGFTPGASNLIYEGPDTSVEIAIASTTYWRVAAFDQWSSGHADANFTAEQTLTI